MNCTKCGVEVSQESKFCNNCGEKIGEFNKREKNKTKLYILTGSAIVLIGIAIIFYFLSYNNPVNKFEAAINNSDYGKAKEVYQEDIFGNLKDETKIDKYLQDAVSSIKKDFTEEKLSYDSAIQKLDTISRSEISVKNLSEAKEDITNLNNSWTSFKTGSEMINNQDLKNGIEELSKVIEDDKNYPNAQKLINDSKAAYKTTTLQDAEKLAGEKKFTEALTQVNAALSIVKDDADLVSKKTIYEVKKKEQEEKDRKAKMEDLKNKQLVIITKSTLVEGDPEYSSLYPDQIQVFATNKSDKKVKSFIVGSVAFDKNGLPIKIEAQFDYNGGDYVKKVSADDANILPGGTFGSGRALSLDSADSGIKTVLSCVESVEFYDGSTWENEYYPLWVEEYSEKPLH